MTAPLHQTGMTSLAASRPDHHSSWGIGLTNTILPYNSLSLQSQHFKESFISEWAHLKTANEKVALQETKKKPTHIMRRNSLH